MKLITKNDVSYYTNDYSSSVLKQERLLQGKYS